MNATRSAGERAITHVMPLSRGTFVLRYAASRAGDAPRIVVSRDPDATGDVQMLFNPDARDGVMRKPGDCCVLSCLGEGRILITTLGSDVAVPDAVTLKLERVDEAVAPAALPAAAMPSVREPAAKPAEGIPVPVRLVGHVEAEGDVVVGSGEWLGSETGQSRIEGFAIQWPRRPAGVDISYGCAVRGLGRFPDAVVGEFVGTRQQARGLSGVSFNLIGEDAASYALRVEAVFQDGTRRGPELAPVSFAGPTGREELVGLSLQLTKIAVDASVARRPNARVNGAKTAAPATRPVRVFRASRSDTHI